MNQIILLYDDLCTPCVKIARVLTRLTKKDSIRFTGIYTDEGERMIKRYSIDPEIFLRSIVVVHDEYVYVEGKALKMVLMSFKTLLIPIALAVSSLPIKYLDGLYRIAVSLAKQSNKQGGRTQ